MPTRLSRALPPWLRALALLLLVALPLNAAELNNSGSGQWSESDSSNTSTSPDGWPVGLAPNQVRGVGQSMMGAIKRFWDRVNPTVTTTGSANAFVYTPTNASFPTAYVTGECFSFKTNFANTGAATLNVNSLGAKNIFKPTTTGPAALTGGEIQSGQLITACYDGTQFQTLNAIPGGVRIAKSGAAVTTAADGNKNTTATIAIGANELGANGMIRYWVTWQSTASVNNKTYKVDFGGTTVSTFVIATASTQFMTITGVIANANATNAQIINSGSLNGTAAPGQDEGETAAIDTTSAQNLVISCTKATAGETCKMTSYLVEVIAF